MKALLWIVVIVSLVIVAVVFRHQVVKEQTPDAEKGRVEVSGAIGVTREVLRCHIPNAPSMTDVTVSDPDLLGNRTVTAPTGFEVSTDNVNFAPTVTVGSAAGETTIYLRSSFELKQQQSPH